MSATALIVLAMIGGVLAGLLALTLVLWLAPRPRQALNTATVESFAEPRRFVFKNRYLIEHSDNVGFLLSPPIDYLKAWDTLIDVLGDIADGVTQAFEDLQDSGRSFRLEGRFGKDRVSIMGVRHGDEVRITMASAETEQNSMRIDLASLEVLQADTDLLTRSSDSAPTLSWVVDSDGRVIWANAAYLALAERCAGPDALRGWPMVGLFPDQTNAPSGKTRRRVNDSKGEAHWFEITSLPPTPDGHRHMHAISLDAVIAAEDNLRTFIQTLTKTFAYLPTGLAIFDRDKNLAMFNPALMDMTGLDGSWLSRRPKLTDFFDALRDHRKLPEPRDYKAWRDGLSDLSRVDEGGTYRETWTLPTGQTYCVTGRPQADGAVALMLEDISADVQATRVHRDERDALLGALCAMDDALVVFGPDGNRIAANTAARRLLTLEDEVTTTTLDDCIQTWRKQFAPSPAWGDLQSFAKGELAQDSEGTEWSETLSSHEGSSISLRIIPTKGGGITLCFAEHHAPAITAAPVTASPVGTSPSETQADDARLHATAQRH